MLRCPFCIMANNLPNVLLPAGEWIDLYAASGLDVGDRIEVTQVGTCDVYLQVSASQPAVDSDSYNILQRGGDRMVNTEGDEGAWAFCPNADGKVSVRGVL